MKKITEATYMRRKNIGNYEHIEASLCGVPDDGQDGLEILKELKETVDTFLNSEKAGDRSDLNQKTKENKDASKKESSKKSKEESSKEEVVEEVIEEDTESEETEAEEEDTEAEEDETPAKPAKPKKSGKVTTYDRSSALHQKLIGEYLDENLPGWEKKYGKFAKSVSNRMQGQEFMDTDGELIPEFGKTFLKKLKTSV